MLSQKIAFVDIETTGTSLSRDLIIEIGIVKVEEIENSTITSPSTFDVIIYNILKRYITSKNISIKPIDKAFLQIP